MTIKDFEVGDEVVYLDFNGYSTPKRTTLRKGYIINVGRKIITISKNQTLLMVLSSLLTIVIRVLVQKIITI